MILIAAVVQRWIDHCVSTKAAHILSDHRPLVVAFKCSHLPRFTAEDTKLCAPQLLWKSASESEIAAYHDHTKRLLSNETLPLSVLSCSTTDCCDRSHYLELIDTTLISLMSYWYRVYTVRENQEKTYLFRDGQGKSGNSMEKSGKTWKKSGRFCWKVLTSYESRSIVYFSYCMSNKLDFILFSLFRHFLTINVAWNV